MKKIFSLTKVFIKEFYENLAIFNQEKKKFNKKSIFFWLIAIIFFGFSYVSYEVITFLVDLGQEQLFLNLYFFVLAIFLVFQTILICTNIFFFSKDIEKILHLPLNPVEILLAKLNTLLCMLYISEGILGVVPLTLYGLLTSAYYTYYLWGIVVLAIFPIFIALVISNFMLLFMRFGKYIRNKEMFQFLITIVMIILICVLENKVLTGLFSINSDEQALQQMTSLSEKAQQVGKNFLIINPSIDLLEKPTNIMSFFSLIKMIGYNLIAGFIFITIGKKTYLKDILRNMISNTNHKKKEIKTKKDIKSSNIRKAYIKKEIKMLIREPIFFMQCVFPVAIILITAIIIIFVLLPSITQIIQDDETIKEALQGLSFNTEVVCDLLIVLQVLFSISNISLTAVSREGKNASFMKYIPISFYQQFVYKNIPQIVLNFIVSFVTLGMIWYIIPNINIFYLVMIFMIAMVINVINSYLMLVVDLRRPNLDWDTEYAVVKKSDNKFFQYAFLIIQVLFLMYLSNILENMNILIALWIELIIFTVLWILLDRCIKKWQNKLFNKII